MHFARAMTLTVQSELTRLTRPSAAARQPKRAAADRHVAYFTLAAAILSDPTGAAEEAATSQQEHPLPGAARAA